MKLSKLTTEQAVDALLQITPSVVNITHDKKVIDAIGTVTDFDGLNNNGIKMRVADRYAQFVTVLLKDHRDDVFNILAALNLSTPDVIKAQPLPETLLQLQEVMDDKELTDFLSKWLPSKQRTPSPQSSNVAD